MKIQVYDKMKKTTITAGTLEGEVFYKVVKPEHFCRKHQCYGIQLEALNDAKELGAEIVVIDCPDGIYESDVDQWLSTQAKKDDLGCGEQMFLPLNKMR